MPFKTKDDGNRALFLGQSGSVIGPAHYRRSSGLEPVKSLFQVLTQYSLAT